MSKIPVAATVSRTYGFLLGEFGTIIRLVWAPLLIGTALSYFFGGPGLDAIINEKANPNAAAEQAPVQFLIAIGGFLTSVMAFVALLRVVLFGDRVPGLFVYLWLGVTEMRLIVSLILLVIAAFAAAIAGSLAAAILGVVAKAVPGMELLLGSLGAIGILAVIVATLVRLSLVPPAVVAENNLGVERSWRLLNGNVMRMFAVLLATYGAYGLLSTLLTLAIFGTDLPPFPSVGGKTPDAVTQEFMAFQVGLARAMRLHWAAIHVLNFVSSVLVTALLAGACGNAYNALTDQSAK